LGLDRPLRRAAALVPARGLRAAADACFWAGVRAAAGEREWQRLTRSSWTALYYHRIAGEDRPGQERLDIAPERFGRQMRLLRRLGFTALSAEEVIAFLDDPGAVLPRRAYVLTADDAYLDCVAALRVHGAHRPHVFVPTAAAGGRAHWTDGEPVASWAQLATLAGAGAAIGSHSRTHAVLPELEPEQLAAELAGSRAELLAALPGAPPMLAYPHGAADERVRRAAGAAGYRIAYTTTPGRNGAGTDPLALRRVGPKAWDTPASLLFKAFTGQLLPGRWTRRLMARHRRTSRRPPSSSRPGGPAGGASRGPAGPPPPAP
jgi:peptidoglycan/xylan/chitin deacetylase (PgdA/CDA1 family)